MQLTVRPTEALAASLPPLSELSPLLTPSLARVPALQPSATPTLTPAALLQSLPASANSLPTAFMPGPSMVMAGIPAAVPQSYSVPAPLLQMPDVRPSTQTAENAAALLPPGTATPLTQAAATPVPIVQPIALPAVPMPPSLYLGPSLPMLIAAVPALQVSAMPAEVPAALVQPIASPFALQASGLQIPAQQPSTRPSELRLTVLLPSMEPTLALYLPAPSTSSKLDLPPSASSPAPALSIPGRQPSFLPASSLASGVAYRAAESMATIRDLQKIPIPAHVPDTTAMPAAEPSHAVAPTADLELNLQPALTPVSVPSRDMPYPFATVVPSPIAVAEITPFSGSPIPHFTVIPAYRSPMQDSFSPHAIPSYQLIPEPGTMSFPESQHAAADTPAQLQMAPGLEAAADSMMPVPSQLQHLKAVSPARLLMPDFGALDLLLGPSPEIAPELPVPSQDESHLYGMVPRIDLTMMPEEGLLPALMPASPTNTPGTTAVEQDQLSMSCNCAHHFVAAWSWCMLPCSPYLMSIYIMSQHLPISACLRACQYVNVSKAGPGVAADGAYNMMSICVCLCTMHVCAGR